MNLPLLSNALRSYRYLLALAGLLLIAPVPAATGTAGPAPLDHVVAIVNNDVITDAELQDRIQLVKNNLRGKPGQLPPEPLLRKQILDSLILERVQLQRARNTGIEVSSDELQQAITSLAQRNKVSVAQLQKNMAREGVAWPAVIAQLKTQLTIQHLLSREVHGRVRISDSDVESFVKARQEQNNSGVEYNLSHILLPVPQNASPEARARVRRQASKLRQEIIKGAAFSTVAIANSKDQYALEGGLIGWRTAAQIPELFVQALIQLNPGEVSPVLSSQNGFHLVRLNDRRGGDTQKFAVTQTHARHILIKRVEGVSDAYLKQRLNQLRRRILNGEDFGQLAKVHSDDVASSVNNGDLGWITPGTMVPTFEQAMDRLQPGVVSAIVESPYGYHLIEVLGRRQKDIGEEKLRADARRELHMRKAEEQYQLWIHRLRDEAYVEIRG
jgi:peptidyl-prolyl cis-trans isomerase SurA